MVINIVPICSKSIYKNVIILFFAWSNTKVNNLNKYKVSDFNAKRNCN
jgi:hypothetical protein